MALNLSRGAPTKHYSSNRIASLMGNGLLTFIDKKTQMNDFFSNKEIIFYNVFFFWLRVGHVNSHLAQLQMFFDFLCFHLSYFSFLF